MEDPALKALAMRAIDAAMSAGATYVDVRFRLTQRENIEVFFGSQYPPPSASFRVGAGVRALVDGYWGFSGLGGLTTGDDMVRLGHEAAIEAAINAQGLPRAIHLAAIPVTTDGNWTMPVAIDPFTVPFEEKVDVMDGMSERFSVQRSDLSTSATLFFVKDERTFASSEGAFLRQTLFTTGGRFGIGLGADWLTDLPGGRTADFLGPAGAGWEYVLHAPFEARMERMIEQARQARRPKPVDIGRYDVVFDATTTAHILDQTIGVATELDRAMGYEANGLGTSFLDDPMTMLGSYTIGNPLLTVTANRSLPGGAATVQWDDEGVHPAETTLITDGVLTNFQTTRESATWLAAYYAKSGHPTRSTGCAGGDAATIPVTQCSPNLAITPGKNGASFEDLIASTKRGYAVVNGRCHADYQALNATVTGEIVYEIRDGKLGSVVRSAQFLVRAPEFWKSLAALGDTGSIQHVGIQRGRLEMSHAYHTVSAVPVKVTQVVVTELGRRA